VSVAARDASGNGVGGSRKNTSEWIPLKEAAAEAGVSVSTLRNWYRKGEIDSRLDRGPHGRQRLVRKNEILDRATAKSSRKNLDRAAAAHNGRGSPDGGDSPKRFADLVRELAEARERAERAESRAEFLTERLARLETRFEALLLSEPSRRDDRAIAPRDGFPEDFPPEEEDEYLPLVERWKARRKRRRLQRDSERVQTPSS
jgi:DNA-binding transcriptional MerR regulator